MDACVGSAFDESFQGFLPKVAHSEVPEMAGEMLTSARRRLGFENCGFGSRGFESRGFGSRGFGSRGFGSRGKCGLWFVVFENKLTVFVAELGKGFAVELKGVAFHIPMNTCPFQSPCADDVDVKVGHVGGVEQDEILRLADGWGNRHWQVSGPENRQLIASGTYEFWM